MNIEYVSFNKDLEIYYGILNKDVTLISKYEDVITTAKKRGGIKLISKVRSKF